MRFLLRSAKNTVNICDNFLRSAKITAKNIAKKRVKKYCYRKYLRYFLRSAKITETICGIFCGAQKIPVKISQNKPKKTYGSYMSVCGESLLETITVAPIQVEMEDKYWSTWNANTRKCETNTVGPVQMQEMQFRVVWRKPAFAL